MPTSQPGALPTYMQIAERLTRDIRAGLYETGTRLPPERRMAVDLGVTVTTLRKSLSILTERGLLERRQGSGNYVLDGQSDLGTYALFHLELPDGGGLPSAKVLDLSKTATPCGCEGLGASAWNIRRLRSLNHHPVAIEDIWVSARYPGSLSDTRLSDALYQTYRTVFGLKIAQVEDRVSVGAAPDWAQGHITFSTLSELGLVRRRAFDQNGDLAEVSNTWFDPSRAGYVARFP